MAKTVRIVGIDPGLRRTGWGIIESDGVRLGYVASGTVVTDSDLQLCQRLAQIYEGLNCALLTYRPSEAAVEQTFVNRDAAGTLKLGQARGIALLAPAIAGLSVAEYAPNAVKKSVTGTGHGSKEQIRAMLRHLLPRANPETGDAADALAIAVTHAHMRQSARLENKLKQYGPGAGLQAGVVP